MLMAARRVFARKGYHRANVSDIIRACGVARGTFYLHFANKRALFGTLLEELLTEIRARMPRLEVGPGAPSPVEQLRRNLLAILRYLLSERDLSDILLHHAEGCDVELDRKLEVFYARMAAQLRHALDEGVRMGLVRPCDTQLAAVSMVGAVKDIIGAVLRGRLRVPSVERLGEEILTLGLCGVARPELARSLTR